MIEYITKEEAKKAVDYAVELFSSEYDAICDKIDRIPNADVAPVVHGKWIHLSGCDVCSVCNYKTGKHEVGRNFCPECGAKLDLDGEE